MMASRKWRIDGDVQVGGMIASVGQRLVETTAKFVIRKFFDKLSEQAGAPEVAGGLSTEPNES